MFLSSIEEFPFVVLFGLQGEFMSYINPKPDLTQTSENKNPN